ncbi:MAG: hypothetical protein RLZZ437_160 [Pseudomonadota bacterium]|jgi:hypothetical protein
MPPQNATGLRAIKDMLNARSTAELSRSFIFPVPAQSNGKLHVYATAQELADGFARLAAVKAQMGQTAFQPRIVAIELPRNNRFRVWVDWLYTDQHGTPCTGERSIYFCSTLRGHTAVEMIQCQPRTKRQPVNHRHAQAQA